MVEVLIGVVLLVLGGAGGWFARKVLEAARRGTSEPETDAAREAERLTIRYALHRLGHEPAPIAGECAVVAVGAEGCLLDMGRHDLAAAARYIRPV